MESSEIRYLNVMELAKQYKTDSQFSNAIDVSPAYFSQIKTRRKNIGDTIARKIETELGLQKGFLDSRPEVKNPIEGIIINPSILSLAYAIESIDPEIREHLKRLVFNWQ